MSTRWSFPIFLLLVVGISFLVVIKAGQTSTNTFLQIQVAPSGASVAIDSHDSGSGKQEINPGQHSVTVRKHGFATQTRAVTVNPGQTVYFGAILEPNSSSTQNWYNKHSSDQKLSQTIADHSADYQSSTDQTATPFLQLLPLSYGDGMGGLVTIAQGVPVPGSSQPAIYVTAKAPSTRQGVLEYMRSRGYDPATMDIVFIGTVDPLQEAGTEDYR
ncbi:MAG TPA: PEGA domain-containing protein [Candidatus Saccharimonadales bacterium]|nr:PEGA domain-containing protein [Candidatus Saccharimonadales bacterium]